MNMFQKIIKHQFLPLQNHMDGEDLVVLSLNRLFNLIISY